MNLSFGASRPCNLKKSLLSPADFAFLAIRTERYNCPMQLVSPFTFLTFVAFRTRCMP